MFWDDIVLVTDLVEKYGFRAPFVDLGGQAQPCVADYVLTVETGDQNARYVSLAQRPFDHLDPTYLILNPEQGDPFIEDLPEAYPAQFGTAVCLNVIEHVQNPFKVFEALYRIMKDDSMLVIETVFSFPYHPSPLDYWRYSPDALRFLAEGAGFQVIECDWRMTFAADLGIQNIHTREPQEIRSVYAVLAKGTFVPRPTDRFRLPARISQNSQANQLIALEGNARTPEDLNRLAEDRYAAGDLTGARWLLRNLLSRWPANADALSNLGVVLSALNEPAAALRQFKLALEHAPHHRDAALNYADLLAGLDPLDPERAGGLAYLERYQHDGEIAARLAQMAGGR